MKARNWPLDAIEQNAANALDARPEFRKKLLEWFTTEHGSMSILVDNPRNGYDIIIDSRHSLFEIANTLYGARDIRAIWLEQEGWAETETSLEMAEEISALAALVAHRKQQAAESAIESEPEDKSRNQEMN